MTEGSRQEGWEDGDGRNVFFEVIRPETQTLPLVFNSPHSGRVYAREFLAASRLDAQQIRRSEDLYVAELFSAAPAFGAARTGGSSARLPMAACTASPSGTSDRLSSDVTRPGAPMRPARPARWR